MSPYPILNNRPIDQWKVTELKEELKRRKLTVKGLKDDLIRRLDEALRVESEIAAMEAKERERAAAAEVAETGNAIIDADPESRGTTEANVVDAVVQEVDINDVLKSAEQGKPEGVSVGVVGSSNVEKGPSGQANLQDPGTQEEGNSNVHLDSEDSKTLLETQNLKPRAGAEDLKPPNKDPPLEATAPQEERGNSNVQLDSEDQKRELEVKNSKSQVEAEDLKPPHEDPPPLESTSLQKEKGNSDIQLDNEDSNRQLETKNSKPEVEAEDLKPPHEDLLPKSTAPDNQVSEVNPNLGFHVKSDSISTSLVSNNENNELKDNKTSDNIKLELDVSNAEMVKPSLSDVVPDGGDSHPTDVEEPNRKAYAEEKDEGIATKGNECKKSESIDMGSSGKLNIDGSSGDDSMEEDLLESKQVDSQDKSDEIGSNNAKSIVSSGEKILVDITGKNSPPGQKQSSIEDKNSHAVPSEKRKLDDRDIDGNIVLSKKQRRWNHKIPEPQSSNRQPTTTPKEVSLTTDLRRNLTSSTHAVSKEAPKERVVPPSSKTPTNSLRIDNFLRPFTLKAVQDLLGKTGSVSSFWMDQIKTHCYVMYSSAEEAMETRNALYNLQWPPNGGRLLVAEFVDPQEVKMRVDAPHSAAPVTPGVAPPAPGTHLHPTPRQQAEKQQLPPPPPLTEPPSLSNKPFGQPAVSAMQEIHEPPIVTLDDLFKKTKATPRIYYRPLSEDQVAKKLAERNRRASIRN